MSNFKIGDKFHPKRDLLDTGKIVEKRANGFYVVFEDQLHGGFGDTLYGPYLPSEVVVVEKPLEPAWNIGFL